MTIYEPQRTHLPESRGSITHKRSICGYKTFTTVSFFEEEGYETEPAEIFISIAKEGTEISGLTDALVTITSIALQYGVPWEKVRSKLLHHRFGYDDGRHKSIVDGIAKVVDEMIRHRCETLGCKLPAYLPLPQLETTGESGESISNAGEEDNV